MLSLSDFFASFASFAGNPSVAKLTFVVGKGGVGKTTVSYALALICPRATLASRRCSCPPTQVFAGRHAGNREKRKNKMTGVSLKARIGLPALRAKSLGRLIVTVSLKNFLKAIEKESSTLLKNADSLTERKSRRCWTPRCPACQRLPDCWHCATCWKAASTITSSWIPRHSDILCGSLNCPDIFRLRIFLRSLPAEMTCWRSVWRTRLKPSPRFFGKMAAHLRQVKEAFSAEQAEVLLVTSPETFSLNEAVRCVDALKESAAEMRLGGVVLNRVVMSAENCPRCRARAASREKGGAISEKYLPARAQADRPRSRKSSARRTPAPALWRHGFCRRTRQPCRPAAKSIIETKTTSSQKPNGPPRKRGSPSRWAKVAWARPRSPPRWLLIQDR